MIDQIWEINPDWHKLNSPAEGDIVQLKHTIAFSHLVKVIVSSVDKDKVAGVVESVFDWETQAQIAGGEFFNLGLFGQPPPHERPVSIINGVLFNYRHQI